MNFCSTCIHWEKTHEDYPNTFGICDSGMVQDKVRFDVENDENNVFTEKNFGCNFWAQKELVVARIKLPKI